MPIFNHDIDVFVIQITNRSHLDYVYYKPKPNSIDLDIELVSNLLRANLLLEKKINVFEIGWFGEPLLHPKISEIVEIMSNYSINININSHGDLVKDWLSILDDKLIKKLRFSISLDGSEKKTIKEITGKDILDKVIESMEYIKKRKLDFDVLFTISSLNYQELEDAYDMSIHYGCSTFIPIEVFPSNNTYKFLLDDKMKIQVRKSLDSIISKGASFKTIQFEEPSANCTYFRKKRIFMDCLGRLSYCHFLAYLDNVHLTKLSEIDLKNMIIVNSELRENFTKIKSKNLISWKLPRKTASPCSYCVYNYGQRVNW